MFRRGTSVLGRIGNAIVYGSLPLFAAAGALLLGRLEWDRIDDMAPMIITVAALGLLGVLAGVTAWMILWLIVGPPSLAIADRIRRRGETVDVERSSPPETGADALVGRIRDGSAPLFSPIANTPCVAFRVVGQIGPWAIDDGEAVTFELDLEPEERVRVVPTPALIAIDVGVTARVDHDALERLERFLVMRGIRIEAGTVHLAESVLCPFDSVCVDGDVGDRSGPAAGGRGLSRRPIDSMRPGLRRTAGRDPKRRRGVASS